MSHSPASGERAALRGYRWQYDHIAARVYDALLKGDFVELWLTDPNAGRVDDLILVQTWRTDGFQFKSVEFDSYLTFNQVVKPQRTRGGTESPSIARSLAEGWRYLRDQRDNAHVHFVTPQLASVNDHLAKPGERPSPDHFSAFLSRVLDPFRQEQITLDEIPSGWRHALKKLYQASGVAQEEFADFLHSLHFDVGERPALPPPGSTRHSDIVALSEALMRLVSEASGRVKLDEQGVLRLMSWHSRFRQQSHHVFPFDVDIYEPLTDAIDELARAVEQHDSGYVAVIGPPGAGKSTLLSQALATVSHRVVRYYAYVPATRTVQTRLTARAFLHDIFIMLKKNPESRREGELPSADLHQLREQFTDQLESAGAEFQDTGKRTIIVVDGLDHVERESGNGSDLLAELPRPSATPSGVLFVIGSRTLSPLNAYARHQLDERQATIDLQHHRLSPAAILRVCGRVPITAGLSQDVHRRIVELCNGHPLTLSYLFNRLRDVNGRSALEILASAPVYEGDVAAEYLAVWDDVEEDDGVVDILSVCSRLRIGFSTDWLQSWAGYTVVRNFKRKLLYLFRRDPDGWRFFHDSFRQFVSDRTSLDDFARPDNRANAEIHARIADLCMESTDKKIAAEQLYHRLCADQYENALALSTQAIFRDHFRNLRSPDLIREDIEFALQSAADRVDVAALFRLLLCLVEVNERSLALENVDMPGLLYEAGLVDEAIAWCGSETRRVPLAQAYDLAYRLGCAHDPAGRRIFDWIEHEGIEDPERGNVMGEENDAAIAWTRAATKFRPLPTVIDTIANLIDTGNGRGQVNRYDLQRRWHRCRLMFQQLVHDQSEDESALEIIDSRLSQIVQQLRANKRQREANSDENRGGLTQDTIVASLMETRVRALNALIEVSESTDITRRRIDELLSMLRGPPLFHSTMLEAAEILANHEYVEQASSLLDRTAYNNALTVRALADPRGEDQVENAFRYWRVRCLIASNQEEVPVSVSPSENTPAGNDVAQGAPVHGDHDAIELAAKIDSAVRTLARLDAASVLEGAESLNDSWATLLPLLDVLVSAGAHKGPSFSLIASKKSILMPLIATVACDWGGDLPQRLSDALGYRIDKEPDSWPLELRVDIGHQLRSMGANVSWYQKCLDALEASAASENMHARLDSMELLIFRYAGDGDTGAARRRVGKLISMAFSVGYRKDNQFYVWVECLKQALAGPNGDRFVDDASWMARLLTATNPMTEGAPGFAAVDLPAALVPVEPVASVRMFEYLVRHGTTQHTDTLANLLQAVVTDDDFDDFASLELASDITGDLLAPAADHEFRELAASLIATAKRINGSAYAGQLAESLARRTDCYALPTTRKGWRQGLGLSEGVTTQDRETNGQSNNSQHGSLSLSDGRQIPRDEVVSLLKNVEDIVKLRREESSDSTFDWTEQIEELDLSNEDVLELSEHFNDGSSRSADVQVALAIVAERNGDLPTALRLASDALLKLSGEAWSRHYGGKCQTASAISIRVAGHDRRVSVCQNLAGHIVGNRWLASLLVLEFGRILEAIDVKMDSGEMWQDIRLYLDGFAESLDMPDAKVLSDQRCRWWLFTPSNDCRSPAKHSSPEVALAELAVGHLSHPAWLVRDAATRVVIRALVGGNKEVAEALGRFAAKDFTDDILERAGRCLAGAEVHDVIDVPRALQPLVRVLQTHQNQILRDLVPRQVRKIYRPLSPIYFLSLSEEAKADESSEHVLLAPHEWQYELLSNRLGLNQDTMLAVATKYASEALESLPDPESVTEALTSSQIQHNYPTERITASRAAFGRVLGDLADARLLEDMSPKDRVLLRTVDPEVLCRAPEHRSSSIPEAPPAGVDKSLSDWLEGIEDRLQEYVECSSGKDRFLIGARTRVTVLNWGHLKEELVCGTTVGTGKVDNGRLMIRRESLILRDLVARPARRWPEEGEPLVVENIGHTFHQINAEWLSFRPDLAATLRWSPDTEKPGCWRTASGELAVDSIWWMDGWWGRAGRSFDNPEAEGQAVVLTLRGLEELTKAFGMVTSHFTLSRRGRDEEVQAKSVSISTSSPVFVPDS